MSEPGNSPARILRQYLIDIGVLVPNSGTIPPGGWASNVDKLPTGSPDNFVTLTDTGGVQRGRDMQTGDRDLHPTILFTVRSVDYFTGYEKGRTLSAVLDKIGVPVTKPGGLGRPVTTVDGAQYRINAVHVTGPLIKIGEEPTNNRVLFTINVMVSITSLNQVSNAINLPAAAIPAPGETELLGYPGDGPLTRYPISSLPFGGTPPDLSDYARLSLANTFTANQTMTGSLAVTGAVTGASFAGGGSGLTGLDAGNISAGTLGGARLPQFTGGDVTTPAAGSVVLSLADGTVTLAKWAAGILDTSAALGTSNTKVPSQNAVKVYVDNSFAANDAMIYKGTINASGNPNYPAADAGHTYKISATGKIGGASGPNVEIGDTIICTVDGSAAGTHAAVGANWTIVQSNLDGAVIGPAASTAGGFARFNGTTGKLLQDSAATLATADYANASVTYGKIQNVSATARLLGRVTAGAGVIEELTQSQGLDFITTTRGSLLQRGASAWGGITGTARQVLRSQGASADLVFGNQYSLSAATDGATVTFDLAADDGWKVTLGGNRTLALSNGYDGQLFRILIKQDGTGSRTVTWWSNIKWGDGGTVPTLTTAANKWDVFTFVRISSTEFLGNVVGKNY